MHDSTTNSQEKAVTITPICTNLISPNPNQPRKEFAQDSILKLADSIKQFGIIQPITVRKIGESYELVSGERRLRAAKELNMPTVPCIVIDIDEEKSAEISIIENLIREDLNIFEQALAIEALIDTYGLTQEQVAQKLSASQSYIANKLRLLRLTAEEREIIISNKLSERHARAVLRIFDQEKRKELLYLIVKDSINVASTEQIVNKLLNSTNEQPTEEQDGSIQAALPANTESSTDSINEARKEARTYKDTTSFCTAISRALECAKASNLEVKSRKIVGDSFTEITIIVPNCKTSHEESV